MDVTFYPDESYETKKHKLHLWDMHKNPERHQFEKISYSKHDIEEMCIECWEQIKDKFVNDFKNDRVIRLL